MATMKSAKGRYPSQEDDDVPDDIKAADESLSNSDDGGAGLSEDYSADKPEPAEPLEIEAESVNKNPPLGENKSTSSPMADQDKASFARAITGATPALMGLLMGASPLMAEDQIVQGQKYYQAGTPKKTVLTMGPDGKPVYIDVRDSIGKEAFTKQAGVSAGGLVRKTYVDKNNNPINLQFDRTGSATELGTLKNKNAEILSGELRPAEATFSTVEGTDEFGRKITERQPLYGQQNAGVKTIGTSYASQVGIPSVKLDEAKEKTQSFMNKKSSIEADARSLKAAQNLILSGDKDSQIKQAAGTTQVLKAVIAEKMSDQEYGRMSTNPGALQGLMDRIDKLQNLSPQEVQKQIKEIAYQMESANSDYLKNLRNDYKKSFGMGNSKYEDYINRALPDVPNAVSPEQRQKNFYEELKKRNLSPVKK